MSESNLSSRDILNLYKAFFQDTIEQATKSAVDKVLFSLTDIDKIVSSTLSDINFFKINSLIDNDKISQDFHIQPEGSFGERMKAAIEWTFNRKYEKLIILGADSPQIQPRIINKAIKLLNSVDVVLGPSAEGGIYLIGIKPNLKLQGYEQLFEGVELSDFAKFAKNQMLNINILEELVDVDQESDLIGLIAWLNSVEIQNKQNMKLLENDKISIPKHTLSILRKIGLTISVDKKNNRGKKLISSN